MVITRITLGVFLTIIYNNNIKFMVSYNNSFKSASLPVPSRHWVDKSHSYSYTARLATIVPTLVDKIAPGESFELRETTKIWTLPFFAPIFSGIYNKSRAFVVPLRKIVPHFEDWLTSNPSDMMESIYTTVFDVVSSGITAVYENCFDSSLADYLGWPSLIRQFCLVCHHQDLEQVNANLSSFGITPGYTSVWAEMQAAAISPLNFDCVYCDDLDVPKPNFEHQTVDLTNFFSQRLSLIPFIAYQKIIDDWLVDKRFEPNYFDDWFNYLSNSNPSSDIYIDYLSSFVFTDLDGETQSRNTLAYLLQKRVIGYGKDYFTTADSAPQRGPDLIIGPEKLDLLFDVTSEGVSSESAHVGPGELVDTGDDGQLFLTGHEGGGQAIGNVWAQVNQADEITPLKLRWQMALQKFLEASNIGGFSRYTDFVLGQTGIRVPDPFLLRSVYLGGYKTPINANPVVAQSDGSDDDGSSSILGEVAATGHGFNSSPMIRGRIAHDYVVLMNLSWNVAETYYYQGFRSIFTDLHVLDMPLWQFKGVGQQPITDKELFFGLKPDNIFGYQKRFSNHKIYHNELHGEFRGDLEYFHTGRKFLQQPHLGGDFIYQRGTDGHDRVFSIDPSVAAPFRITKTYFYRHRMNL